MQIKTPSIKQGIITCIPDSVDDIWLLSQIIQQEDWVKAKTLRKIEGKRQSEQRSTGAIRKPMVLTVAVEKIEFTGESLRILGIIQQGPESVTNGEHHTLVIEVATQLTITKKQWPAYMVQRLQEATRAKQQSIGIIVFDRQEATVGIVTTQGYKIHSTFQSSAAKKTHLPQVAGKDFFTQMIQVIEQVHQHQPFNTLIVGSPGFWKDSFINHIKEHSLAKSCKIVSVQVNDTGKQGIEEALRRPEMNQALVEARFSQQMIEVDLFLEYLAKGQPVAYGLADCTKAVEMGAVDTLLVSEQYILQSRLDNSTQAIEHMLEQAYQMKSTVVFVGNNVAGDKVCGLGGVVARLRYALE